MARTLDLYGTETVKIGPLVLSSDGVTRATGLTIPYSEVLLSKEDGTLAVKEDVTDCVEDSEGLYDAVLGPLDLNTAGSLTVTVATTGILAWWGEHTVGKELAGQADGRGLSTCLMQLGPYVTKANGRYETSAVSGVIVDVYTGTAPALGAGTPSVATGNSGMVRFIFAPGSSKTPWYARATYPTGSWDSSQASQVYVHTTALN